jgi:hypothetical protein
MRISRRGVLAGFVSGVAAVVAGGLARTEALLAAGHDGRPVALGGRYDDVRTVTSFQAASDGTPMLRFSAIVAGEDRHSLEVGPDGLHAQRQGHWRQQSVVIDGGVRATGSGAEAAAVGPMIVGEGDSMGVYGAARTEGTGVLGRGTVGIEGVGQRGGVLAGDVAQLRLRPSDQDSHPASGAPGDFFVDASRRLWFCRGGTDWSRIA